MNHGGYPRTRIHLTTLKPPGVDEGLNQFIHGQTPMHTDPPPMVDISQYPDTAETKGASSTALFNKYSTTITKNGERLDSITVNQPNLWLTEMKQDQDGKLCISLRARDTFLTSRHCPTMQQAKTPTGGSSTTTSCATPRPPRSASATSRCRTTTGAGTRASRS